jgi:drug/metabolite transporter (DMT)-like permease
MTLRNRMGVVAALLIVLGALSTTVAYAAPRHAVVSVASAAPAGGTRKKPEQTKGESETNKWFGIGGGLAGGIVIGLGYVLLRRRDGSQVGGVR